LKDLFLLFPLLAFLYARNKFSIEQILLYKLLWVFIL